jgi:hypothetical protein
MKAMVRNSHGSTDALALKGHLQARDRRRRGAAIAGLAMSQSPGSPCREQPGTTVVPVHLFTRVAGGIFAFLLYGSQLVYARSQPASPR